MKENWEYLQRDNIEFWGEYLEESKDAIEAKMLSHYDFDVEAYDPDEFKVSMIIDSTILPSSRTGGGPSSTIFAQRFPYIVEEAFYNGWKKCHGI